MSVNDFWGWYNQALKARPDYAEAYFNIGVALMERGEFDTAIANQRKALEIKPDYAWAHYHLGRALHESEDFYGAVESFKQALHFAPDTVEILSSGSHHLNSGVVILFKF